MILLFTNQDLIVAYRFGNFNLTASLHPRYTGNVPL
jgi:hypothetical protein